MAVDGAIGTDIGPKAVEGSATGASSSRSVDSQVPFEISQFIDATGFRFDVDVKIIQLRKNPASRQQKKDIIKAKKQAFKTLKERFERLPNRYESDKAVILQAFNKEKEVIEKKAETAISAINADRGKPPADTLRAKASETVVTTAVQSGVAFVADVFTTVGNPDVL